LPNQLTPWDRRPSWEACVRQFWLFLPTRLRGAMHGLIITYVDYHDQVPDVGQLRVNRPSDQINRLFAVVPSFQDRCFAQAAVTAINGQRATLGWRARERGCALRQEPKLSPSLSRPRLRRAG